MNDVTKGKVKKITEIRNCREPTLGGDPQQWHKHDIIDHSSQRPDFTSGKNVSR